MKNPFFEDREIKIKEKNDKYDYFKLMNEEKNSNVIS